MPRRISTVSDNQLHPADGGPPIALGSPAWEAWLADPANSSFSYRAEGGTITVRRERKGGGWYWYAYRASRGRLRKAYLGGAASVSPERLREVALSLTAAPGGPDIRIALLGPPSLSRDGRAVAAPAKAHALLAYLGMHAAPQLRERLLDLLWPESAPETARKNLRNLLWRLRRDLQPDLIQGEERLALAADAQVDVRTFLAAAELMEQQTAPGALRQARAMARLYGGPLLDGVALAEAPELELWLTAAREQLHELHLRALHQIIAAERAAGRWPQVLAAARAALAHDPDPEAQALAAYLLGAELRAVGEDLEAVGEDLEAAVAQLAEAARLAALEQGL